MTDREPETGTEPAPNTAASGADADLDRLPYLFLTGAAMDPTRVRAAYPRARFVARARLASAGDAAALPERWGILLALPTADVGLTATDEVVADDGRRFRALIPTADHLAGTPAEGLAAARYWELPPAYVRWWRDKVAGSNQGDDGDG